MIWHGSYPIPGPVCGPLALAFVLQRPFPEVLVELADARHTNWRGKMTGRERDRYMISKGFKFRHHFYRRNAVRLHQWARMWAKPDVAYLVTITGHVLIVWNGCCYDQSGVEVMHLYEWRNRYIVAVTHFRNNGHALF